MANTAEAGLQLECCAQIVDAGRNIEINDLVLVHRLGVRPGSNGLAACGIHVTVLGYPTSPVSIGVARAVGTPADCGYSWK